MDEKSRSSLIEQLAMSMGAVTEQQVKLDQTRYDSSTGTLYCNGVKFSKNVVDDAVNYFRRLQAQANASGSREMQNIGVYYQIAVECILMMENGGSGSGGEKKQ
ncbi:MAG: hypothetical protein K6F86_08730 [Lachnospiraceae bacterium]|nr:hypothetical protein [Lachnospiraceae bacterium]